MSEERVLLQDLVRNGRLRLGLTQTEFARKVDTSQKAVSQMERGEIRQPRTDVLMQLARVLEVPLVDVMRSVGRSAGGVTIEDLFNDGYVPNEQREAMETLAHLPPVRQTQVQDVIDALAWAERRDSGAQLDGRLTPEWQRKIEKLMSLSTEQQKEVQRYIDWVAEHGESNPSEGAVPVAP